MKHWFILQITYLYSGVASFFSPGGQNEGKAFLKEGKTLKKLLVFTTVYRKMPIYKFSSKLGGGWVSWGWGARHFTGVAISPLSPRIATPLAV